MPFLLTIFTFTVFYLVFLEGRHVIKRSAMQNYSSLETAITSVISCSECTPIAILWYVYMPLNLMLIVTSGQTNLYTPIYQLYSRFPFFRILKINKEQCYLNLQYPGVVFSLLPSTLVIRLEWFPFQPSFQLH